MHVASLRTSAASCIIPDMSDTHEGPTLSRKVEQEHRYAGIEKYSNGDVDERSLRGCSYAKVSIGLAGLLADVFLALHLTGMALNPSSVIVGLIAVVVASASSVWLLDQGFGGLRDTRSLQPSRRHRSIRGGRQESIEKSAERQLLEVIDVNGETTPARAALQTSLTVEEAEQLLSDLAQKGHLDVRVDGNRLVYSL